jgi:hypothetical protein
MDNIIQIISTIAIAVLAGICIYLGTPKYRLSFVSVGQSCMRWFASLLIVLLLMRLMTLFDPSYLQIQKIVNSVAFFITVAGITWSVAYYERTHKR